MTIFILTTAAFGFCVGVAVLWANPSRFVNQMFSMVSVLMLLSLLALYAAVHARHLFEVDNNTNPVPWVRLGGALSGLFPWCLWILKESVLAAETGKLITLRRSLPWLLV
ncbi:MAG: hypothetical protein ABIZ81_08505, partial [Opitutaceae bacterium]